DGLVGVVTSLVSQPPRQSRKAPRLDNDRARTSSGRGGFGNRASEVCRTMPRRTVGLSDWGVSPVEVPRPDGADDALGLVGVVEPGEGPLAVLGPDREVGPPELGTPRVD